jgi:hypothetical protein
MHIGAFPSQFYLRSSMQLRLDLPQKLDLVLPDKIGFRYR